MLSLSILESRKHYTFLTFLFSGTKHYQLDNGNLIVFDPENTLVSYSCIIKDRLTNEEKTSQPFSFQGKPSRTIECSCVMVNQSLLYTKYVRRGNGWVGQRIAYSVNRRN